MIWDDVRRTFEDYFPRQSFNFEIFHAKNPEETECTAVLKIGRGPREQKVKLTLESEANIKYIRVTSPVVSVDRCEKEQIIRLMEQNTFWVHTRVGGPQTRSCFLQHWSPYENSKPIRPPWVMPMTRLARRAGPNGDLVVRS